MTPSTAQQRVGIPRKAHARPAWFTNLRHDWLGHLFLGSGLCIAAIPILFMLLISVKNQGQYLTQPLAITLPLQWDNYTIAFNVLKRSISVSLLLVVANISGSLLVASISAYVFARFTFPGREALFWIIAILLFIPGILTFAPSFVVASQFKLVDTLWVLIIPAIAGSQVFQIFVLRSFFASLPEEVLEAARVDGANVLRIFWSIVLPMSRPILATLAVMQTFSVWNSWLWPLITIRDPALRPMALQVFFLASDMGPHVGRQMAGYVIASVPLLILFLFFNRQFVEGLSSGAIKW